MTILVTGAAGFIGMHVSEALLARGERVVGVDNLNDYYDVSLKAARLARLEKHENFTFHKVDMADHAGFTAVMAGQEGITGVIHLAAQAGVRHSLTHPFDYADANVTGFLTILEYCRGLETPPHLVYASSSSVYGANNELPYSVDQAADRPVSLYAATKKANELMAYTYAHLYGLPSTGLRFFTVYGPWGRPDMAYWLFTDKILKNEPVQIYNHGNMMRDFTYIDDLVTGILSVLSHPPQKTDAEPPHKVYNLGNNQAEQLLDFVAIIEKTLGLTAVRELLPMQPGDVKATFADIDPIRRDVGYEPTTSLEEGLPKFVKWYQEYSSKD
ncbi:NAD-dependent epimerase/dehydratase family protein [Sneathiella sp.]|uniref:NAD-dependent epimerase/dehydratase family protein n=1 Tax=Sneathiella sp. TaxID=1964365 RepID=UPI00262D7155|nr:NAD-dependent epimerase/dehydratase family protein [Sneathiella sp.]MDF2367252.1 NAD-dependent epimerase/dehydratase family protein [Sneathiella sp.]